MLKLSDLAAVAAMFTPFVLLLIFAAIVARYTG